MIPFITLAEQEIIQMLWKSSFNISNLLLWKQRMNISINLYGHGNMHDQMKHLPDCRMGQFFIESHFWLISVDCKYTSRCRHAGLAPNQMCLAAAKRDMPSKCLLLDEETCMCLLLLGPKQCMQAARACFMLGVLDISKTHLRLFSSECLPKFWRYWFYFWTKRNANTVPVVLGF